MIEFVSMAPPSGKDFRKSFIYLGFGDFYKLLQNIYSELFSYYIFIIENLESAGRQKH